MTFANHRRFKHSPLASWIIGSTVLVCACSAAQLSATSIFDDETVTHPAPSTTQPSSAPAATDLRSATGAAKEPPLQRRPVPPKADRDRSRKLLESAFARELQNPAPSARRDFARRLLEEGLKAVDVPSDQFELLAGAVQSAKEGADLPSCVRAADALGSTFQVDPSRIAVTAALGMKLQTDPPAMRIANCDAALKLIDLLIADEDYNTAEKLLEAVRPAAAADAGTRQGVADRMRVVQSTRAGNERLARLQQQSKAAPNDPAVKLALGEELAFVHSQWTQGLPHLASGSDVELKGLATRDLSAPTSSEEMRMLGNDWWDAGLKRPGAAGVAMRARGYQWLSTSLPKLRGLERIATLNRMHELPFAATAAGQLASFDGRAGAVGVVAFAPDGRSFLTSGSDGVVRLCDLITGEELRRFEGHTGPVGRLSVASTGGIFVTSGGDGTIRFWNLDSGKELHRFDYNDACQSTISPDGRLAEIAANNAGPFLCTTDSFKFNPGFHSEGNYASAWSANGQYVATGGWNQIVHIIDGKSLKEVRSIKQPERVYFIAMTPDGHKVLSGADTRVVHVFDVQSGRKLFDFDAGEHVHAIAITPDNRFALVASEQATLALTDLESQVGATQLIGRQSSVTSVAISRDGKLVLSGDADGSVRLWRLPASREPQ